MKLNRILTAAALSLTLALAPACSRQAPETAGSAAAGAENPAENGANDTADPAENADTGAEDPAGNSSDGAENPAGNASTDIPAAENTSPSSSPAGAPDYSQPSSWAWMETEAGGREADIFFVCPTVYSGSQDSFNMSLSDEDTKADFLGAVNMEKGIYDGSGRFFAPYYRQIGLNVYEMPETDREPWLEIALADVEDAFEYYWDNYNDGRPVVLAGFSQGADLCVRLLENCFDEEDRMDRLVACYAIGWRVTDEDLSAFPHLKMAEGENDTGVIISFNSEAENVTDSLMIPAGTKTHAINPLNWKTDGTPADKSMNPGACFTDYSGQILSEIPELTGAYIDGERGALKVPDVSPEDYPPGLDIFTDGVYHLYDYQFFYRSLQKNVQTRVDAWLSAR